MSFGFLELILIPLVPNASPVDSLSLFGSYIDNSLGQRELLGISYTREF